VTIPSTRQPLGRRHLLKGASAALGIAVLGPLLAACGGAPSPTAAPAKPTEAPKPAADSKPAAAPTTAPAAAAPTTAPAAAATKPAAAPAAPTKPADAAAKPAEPTKPAEAAKPAAAAQTGGPATTIRFMTTLNQPERVEGQKKLLENFEKAQSAVKVKLEVLSWDEAATKYLAMVAANDPPDTSTGGNTWPLTYANQNAIREADPLIDLVGGKKSFYDSELVAYTFKGKVWALPLYQTPDVLIYRKDMFQEKGITAPNIDTDYGFTWEQFREAAKKLTGNGVFGLVEPLADLHGYKPLWGFMLSNGASVLDKDNKLAFNNPETIEVYEYAAALYKESNPTGQTTYQMSDSNTAVKTGKAAMTIWNTGLLREIKLDQPALLEKIGVIGTPKRKEKGGFKGAVNMMLYKTKNVDPVNEFYKFLYTRTNYANLLLASPELMLPSRPEASEAPEYLNSPELTATKAQMAIAVKTLPNSAGLTLKYGPNPWGGEIEAKKVLQGVLIDMLANGTAAAAAVKKGEGALKEIMS
jgi:multiple sugar transport system substrate-binding protein